MPQAFLSLKVRFETEALSDGHGRFRARLEGLYGCGGVRGLCFMSGSWDRVIRFALGEERGGGPGLLPFGE